jgi:hypothetical protein
MFEGELRFVRPVGLKVLQNADATDARSRTKRMATKPRSRPERARYNGRSAAAVRVRTLTAGFLAQLGAAAEDPIVKLQVARAAELTMLAETARAKAIRGEAVDLDHLIRLESMCTRAVRALRLPAARRESEQLTLQAYLQQHYGERAEKPADAFEAGSPDSENAMGPDTAARETVSHERTDDGGAT